MDVFPIIMYVLIIIIVIIMIAFVNYDKKQKEKEKILRSENIVQHNKNEIEAYDVFTSNLTNIDDKLLIWYYKNSNIRFAIAYDKVNKKICIISKCNQVFTFDFKEIIRCEFRTDTKTTTTGKTTKSGTIPRAIIGGAIAGGAGAIVGGLSNKELHKSTTETSVQSYYLDVYTSNPNIPFFTIDHRNEVVLKKWYGYILILINYNNEGNIKKNQPNNISSVDEIIKLKELLDSNIINQEEFDNEKRKILDRN